MSDARPFAAAWLALREDADHRSRSEALNAALAHWLTARGSATSPVSVVDLGCGTGSNLRYLAPRLALAQHWWLLDNNDALLARVMPPATPAEGALQWYPRRANLADWLPAPQKMQQALSGSDVVSGAALLDLFSASWLDRLAAGCSEARAAVLMALSVNGDWRFHGASDDGGDARVLALFRAHQRRDKGLGPALGGEAPVYFAHRLEKYGYQVWLEPSPWQLAADTGDTGLAMALIQGWQQAAAEQLEETPAWLDDWCWRRCEQFRQGEATLEVGHLDLLALPGEAS